MWKMMSLKPFTSLAVISALTALAACGGGGGSSTSQGSLSVAITDAPVDYADQVRVHVTSITMKPKGGVAQTLPVDLPVDLLNVQSGLSNPLVENVKVPAGDYEFMRLGIDLEDSFVVIADEQHPFIIPEGSEAGLTMAGGFSVPASGNASFTIDFDLRRSILGSSPVGFVLEPVLRLVDNSTVGSIEGAVSEFVMDTEGCTSDLSTGSGNVVYVFTGSRVVPTDVGKKAIQAVNSAGVPIDDNYRAAFLPEGDYTVAFTCQGRDDYPATEENIAFVQTDESLSVHVTAGEVARLDFDVGAPPPPTGTVRGDVDVSLLNSDVRCDVDESTGSGAAVYLFEKLNGISISPGDIGGDLPNPVAVLDVVMNEATGLYEFATDYVLKGDYTAALTCQADLDNPLTGEDILFVDTSELSVKKGKAVIVSLGNALLSDLKGAAAALEGTLGGSATYTELMTLLDSLSGAVSSPQLDQINALVEQLNTEFPGSVDELMQMVDRLYALGLNGWLRQTLQAELNRVNNEVTGNATLDDLTTLVESVGSTVSTDELNQIDDLVTQLESQLGAGEVADLATVLDELRGLL